MTRVAATSGGNTRGGSAAHNPATPDRLHVVTVRDHRHHAGIAVIGAMGGGDLERLEVGGTNLCTNAVTGTSIDGNSPPGACQANTGVREVAWVGSGGGYSILFPRRAFQDALPPGSTFVGSSVGAPGPTPT